MSPLPTSVIQNGRFTTFAAPLFEAFGKHAAVAYRELIGACITRLLPRPLLRDRGPAHLELTAVARQGSLAVHVISFLPTRHADGLDMVHDPFPLVAVPIDIRCERPPRSVKLQPHDQVLPYRHADGYVSVELSLLDGHGMIVIEH